MHEIIGIKVILPDDGLSLEDVLGRLVSDLKKLASLSAIPTIIGDEKVIRHINVLHKKGKLAEYRIEDYLIAPNETAYSFPDWKKHISLLDLDKL